MRCIMRALVGAISISLLACTGNSDELPVRFETAHFRYHADPERWLCPRIGEWLEHHYAIHRDWLGGAPTVKIDYFLLANQAAVRERCGEAHGVTPSGCVIGSSVYTWRAVHPHELIHAYALALGNLPPLFFNEGLAVMLGGGPGGMVDRATDIAALMQSDVFRQVGDPAFDAAYLAAGSFTRFLVERHGRDAYLRFFVAVPTEAPSEALRDAFDTAFGESLDTAVADWRAGPLESEADFRMHLAECAADPLADPVSTIDVLPCDAFGSVGSFSIVRSFSLTQPSGVVVRLRSRAEAVARIDACTGNLRPVRELHSFTPAQLGTTRELWTDLPAGQYWLHVSTDGEPADQTTDALATVERVGPLFADSCDGASVRSVAADTAEVVVAGSLDGAADDAPLDGFADVTTRFVLEEPRVAESTSYSPSDIDHVTVCRGTCPADVQASCTQQVTGTMLDAASTHALTIDGMSGEHGFRWGLQLHVP